MALALRVRIHEIGGFFQFSGKPAYSRRDPAPLRYLDSRSRSRFASSVAVRVFDILGQSGGKVGCAGQRRPHRNSKRAEAIQASGFLNASSSRISTRLADIP